jgi:hypothetical protein
MIRPAPLLTIAPSYSILSIEAGEREHNPHVAIYLKLGGLTYILGGCFWGRTSENSVMTKFAFWAFSEVRFKGILRSWTSALRSSRKFTCQVFSEVRPVKIRTGEFSSPVLSYLRFLAISGSFRC